MYSPKGIDTAPSQTRSAQSASATKLGSPGVSRTLTFLPCHSSDARLAEIELLKLSRLSVAEILPEEWRYILKLAAGK